MLPILLGETDVTLNGAVTIGDQLKTGFNLRGPSICMTLERVSSVIKTERLYIGTNTLQNHLKLEIAKQQEGSRSQMARISFRLKSK